MNVVELSLNERRFSKNGFSNPIREQTKGINQILISFQILKRQTNPMLIECIQLSKQWSVSKCSYLTDINI